MSSSDSQKWIELIGSCEDFFSLSDVIINFDFVAEKMNTKSKYLNGPYCRYIGPQISPCIRSKNVRDTLNFRWWRSKYQPPLGTSATYWIKESRLFNECSHDFLIIFLQHYKPRMAQPITPKNKFIKIRKLLIYNNVLNFWFICS